MAARKRLYPCLILRYALPKGGNMNILCLGDSLTYGYGVPRDEAWCSLAPGL